MLYAAEVAVFSEIDAKQIQCGENVWFLIVKPVGARNQ